MDRREAIEIIIKNYPHVSNSGSQFESALRELIPELAESEDERIRKNLIELLLDTPVQDIISHHLELSKVLAYLEKQKEQKPVTNDVQQECPYKDLTLVKDFFGKYKRKCKLSNKACSSKECEEWNKLQADFKRINETFENGKEVVINHPEAFGLQNPISTKETELNSIAFLEQLGYTCVPPGVKQKHIEDVIENITKNKEAATKFLKSAGIMDDNGELAEMYRSEQKPAVEQQGGTFNSYDMAKTFAEGQYYVMKHPEKFGLCKPAEWRDTDMKEARNNLISVCRDWERGEHTTLLPVAAVHARYFLEHITEPKPAEWSEEDEKKITFLERLIRYNVPEGQYGWTDRHKGGFVTKLEAISILKSLRPQPHWKPSKKQMWALEWKINNTPVHAWQRKELESLYNDLQKLP